MRVLVFILEEAFHNYFFFSWRAAFPTFLWLFTRKVKVTQNLTRLTLIVTHPDIFSPSFQAGQSPVRHRRDDCAVLGSPQWIDPLPFAGTEGRCQYASIEVLQYWSTAVLKYCSIGVPQYWSTAVLKYCREHHCWSSFAQIWIFSLG